jgi:cell division protein FtsN
LKIVVILFLVLNFLALLLLVPDDNGSAGISSSDEMSASGLSLLSEVDVELRAPDVGEVKLTTVVESTSVVKEIAPTDTSIGRETTAKKQQTAILVAPKSGVLTQQTTILIAPDPEELKQRDVILSTAAKLRSAPLLRENQFFQCGIVNDINSIDAAGRLKKKLAKLGVKNFIIATSESTQHKYWVYLGPYRTKQQAIDANNRLRAKKHSGYVFTNDEVQYSISVGVFSSSENATRLQSELSLSGYRAKIWDQHVSLFGLKADVPLDDSAISALISEEGHVISTCK